MGDTLQGLLDTKGQGVEVVLTEVGYAEPTKPRLMKISGDPPEVFLRRRVMAAVRDSSMEWVLEAIRVWHDRQADDPPTGPEGLAWHALRGSAFGDALAPTQDAGVDVAQLFAAAMGRCLSAGLTVPSNLLKLAGLTQEVSA